MFFYGLRIWKKQKKVVIFVVWNVGARRQQETIEKEFLIALLF